MTKLKAKVLNDIPAKKKKISLKSNVTVIIGKGKKAVEVEEKITGKKFLVMMPEKVEKTYRFHNQIIQQGAYTFLQALTYALGLQSQINPFTSSGSPYIEIYYTQGTTTNSSSISNLIVIPQYSNPNTGYVYFFGTFTPSSSGTINKAILYVVFRYVCFNGYSSCGSGSTAPTPFAVAKNINIQYSANVTVSLVWEIQINIPHTLQSPWTMIKTLFLFQNSTGYSIQTFGNTIYVVGAGSGKEQICNTSFLYLSYTSSHSFLYINVYGQPEFVFFAYLQTTNTSTTAKIYVTGIAVTSFGAITNGSGKKGCGLWIEKLSTGPAIPTHGLPFAPVFIDIFVTGSFVTTFTTS